MKIWKPSVIVPLAALILIGCGDKQADPAAQSGNGRAAETRLTIGLVFDQGGRGDKAFNDSAYRGLEKAQKELDVIIRPVDSKKASDYEPNLQALAENDCDLVIAVGSNMEQALKSVAEKNPTVKFAIVDASVPLPNVRSLTFAEEQGSFLAGCVAGLMTKTNKVGFVGGVAIPIIKKFEAGYAAGAKYANPNVQILPAKYTGSWDDVALGKESAKALYEGGADIVFHAAGRAGLGVFTAAKESNKFAIGVDSDQDYLEPGLILTSMIKSVDEAVFSSVKDLKEGQFDAGVKAYDLAQGGVGLSEMKFTKDKIGAENLKKIEEAREKIIKGEIKVPTE